MSRAPSILSRVITATATRLAQHPSIPAENRPAFAATAETVMHGQWADMFGGETVWVRIYAARSNSQARADRRARILLALAAGQSVATVAHSEGVSTSWVRKLRLAEGLPCMESPAAAVDDAGISNAR